MPEHGSSLRARIMATLDEIKDPCSVATGTPLGLVEMGLIKQLDISAEGAVDIHLRLTAPFCHMIAFFKKETAERIGALDGVCSVELKPDNGLDWSQEHMSAAARKQREEQFARANAQLVNI